MPSTPSSSSSPSTMDTTGFNQVGRYGTLSLLKRPTPIVTTGTTEANYTMSPSQTRVITSFGIDSANLTFGSVTTCDVRLYYPQVDQVHCRLVNEDGKAFLVVQGKAGALVDGCWVYPHTSSSSSSGPQQTITPLTNNSEFEIHNKRFRFTYPPKEVRKVLLATPVAHRNRTLRLSMIQSAQVFTPRPSKDPRENLKILQSPLKTSVFSSTNGTSAARERSASPTKPRAVSPLKFGLRMNEDSDEDDEDDNHNDKDEDGNDENENTNGEEHIILAHTNHPRVVEEDQDLVILEDIPLHLMLPSPSVYGSTTGTPVRGRAMDPPGTPTPNPGLVQPQPQQAQPQAQAQAQPPRTPRRKSLGGNALHRAVLIRSAQRAVWRAEREKEEEEEEMEVLGAVVAPGADERDEDEEVEEVDEDVEMRSVSSDEDEDEDEDHFAGEDGDEPIESRHDEEKVEAKPLWKKIIPWPFGAKKDDKEDEEEDAEMEHKEDDNELHEEEEEKEANEKVTPLPVMPQQHTPIRRALGSFMTPQAHQPAQARKGLFPSAVSGTTSASEHSEGQSSVTTTTSTTSHAGPGRYSLGGGEARRVVVQQPWRVKDLVVPPLVTAAASVAPTPEPVSRAADSNPGTPSTAGAGVRAPRLSVSEEERKAIQERRRSAVREVREDSFWKDGAPGMSPAKKPPPGLGLGLGRPMSSPRKPLLSPTKGHLLGYSIAEADGESEVGAGEGAGQSAAKPAAGTTTTKEAESTVDLLERMRETVEDMKRRRSIATLSTPRTTLLDGDNTGMRAAGSSAIRGSVKKLDFSHITPAQPKRRVDESKLAAAAADPKPDLASGADDEAKNDDEEIVEPKEAEPFSLLRPGARPSLSPKKMESAAAMMRDVPAVAVDTVQDDVERPEEDDAHANGRTRGRSRLLRAPKVHEVVEDHEEDKAEEEEPSQPKTKSSTKPSSRSKPPSTTKPRSRTARSPVPPTVPEDSLAPEPSGSGTRRQRSRTPQPRQEEVEKTEPEPEVERAPTRSLPKRTRKGTAEPEEPPVAPKKRGKKVVAEPEPEPEPEPEEVEEEVVEKVKPTPAKRGRKPRAAATPTPVEEEEEEEQEQRAPPPTATKRGRSTKKVKEVAPAAEGDEDELDSYEVTQPPANVKKAGTSKIPARIPTLARGHSKRGVEVATPEPPVEEEEESVPLAATRAGRAPRANSNATAAATRTRTPANTTTATTGRATASGAAAKPRGRVKTPASAPAAVATSATAGGGAEKENTPGAGSGSANGSDEEPAVTKVRVSRKTTPAAAAAGSGKTARTTTSKTKATKAAVKVEQNEDEEQEVVAGGRTRTTRIMRTRTKTG